MPIQILKPEVAAKIAAGEVVERPASVVKELIENSLDAGTTQISVEVQGGGVKLIRVADNGEGMGQGEVERAFQRHATSKVSSVEDLEAIGTLGFRGEALPSIAAVAEVEMLTRSRDDSAATHLYLKEGAVVQKEARSRAQGTTVTVRNLFRNVPARLKFLKTVSTEANRISNLVSQYSMAYPEVRYDLSIDGKATFSSPGTGNLIDTLVKVYGLETAQAMLEVGGGEGEIQVNGFIGSPSVSRASRGYISLFINRRWVQSRLLTYAVEEAYQGMLMVGRHPIVVLNITLPLGDVDVNVHPTKSEVRFRREREVFAAVQKAVREALIQQSPVPSPRTEPGPASGNIPYAHPASLFEKVAPTHKPETAAPPGAGEPLTPKATLPVLRVLGQVSNTYVVAEGPDGVFLIDQHAAHERVLFERIQRGLEVGGGEVQGMLAPATVELTPQQEGLLKAQEALLAEYGFSIEAFGERTYLLRAVPAALEGRSASQALINILDSLGEEGSNSQIRHNIASSIACHSAVRAGDELSSEEMGELVRQLELAEVPHTCPHGRPTMIHLSASQLEREFGRR